MTRVASERHRLTEDPVSLTDPADIRAACEIPLDRLLSRGGLRVKSRIQPQATLISLRDDTPARRDRAAANALLGDLSEEIAGRLLAPAAVHRAEMLALLSETRPAGDSKASRERYRQTLAKHGIVPIAN